MVIPLHQQILPDSISEKKNVHDHHRKKIFWGTFLASKKKLSRSVVDTKTLWKPGKPYHYGKRARFAISTAIYSLRCHMPDIENSRKTSEKSAEWLAVKQPKNRPKNSQNSRKTAVKTAVFRVFWLFFRLFYRCFTASHSAPFSAVFRLFSMSGMWHLRL